MQLLPSSVMRFFSKVLPSKADYPQLAVWMFCVAWLVGSIALIIGLNGDTGEIPAIFIFAIACVMWRGAYKLRGRKRNPGNAIGFLALAIWIVNLLGAFAFDYHRYVTDLFFWTSAATLLLLILTATLFENLIW
jgi:hypothetical protein